LHDIAARLEDQASYYETLEGPDEYEDDEENE